MPHAAVVRWYIKMGVKIEDVVPGAIMEVINNTKLKDGPELMFMHEDCDYFGGSAILPAGTKIQITANPDNRVVRTGKSVEFSIVGDDSNKLYSTFWMLFKPRVKLCQ